MYVPETLPPVFRVLCSEVLCVFAINKIGVCHKKAFFLFVLSLICIIFAQKYYENSKFK